MNSDILNISDLVSGHEADGHGGGYLRFDAVAKNSDGTTTLQLSIGSDSPVTAEALPLATLVMSGQESLSGVDAGSFTQHVLEQLVSGTDLIF